MGDPSAPRARSLGRGGRRVAYLDWGGTGAAVVLLHPNGFCAGVFDPLARRLAASARVVGVDLIGHGGSTRGDDPRDLGYDHMATCVLAVAEANGFESFSIAGVSLGGGVAIEVARRAPERVSRVMLNEAIAFPTPPGPVAAVNPMAEGARRRRPVWPDRQAMATSYGGRPPLDELHPDALAGYVRWGTRRLPDGRVQLACAPETEATLFSTPTDGRRHAAEAFAGLGALAGKASVLAGSSTYLAHAWFEAQAGLVATDVEWVDGGHFFLLEDPERGAALVRRHLLGR